MSDVVEDDDDQTVAGVRAVMAKQKIIKEKLQATVI